MIIAPLLLALLAAAPDLGPMLPPGINPNFQAAAIAVETKLSAGDFAAAREASRLLPKPTITIQWDDSKVPAPLKKEYADQRDQAITTWSGITKTIIKIGNDHPDLKFDFVDLLPNPPNVGIPAGATYFWSEDAKDPRLETVIGLRRMTPPEAISAFNVHNEVAAAIGCYLGLTPSPFPGTFMGRTDMNSQAPNVAIPPEMLLARDALKIAADLRTAVTKKQKLTPAVPKVFFDPKSIDLGQVTQGDDPAFTVQVSNTGNAPLAMRFQPDCNCVSTAEKYQVIQPGATYLLKGGYNTLLTVGEIHHTLLVNTNDADMPTFTVPVGIKVKPRYRFLFPEGTVVKLPEQGAVFHIYLVLEDNAGIIPKDAQIAGVPGDISFKPWSGKIADPQLNEPARLRKGYELTVHLTGALPAPGRDPITIWMTTDNAKFPTLQANMFAQRGLVVMPPELYTGEIGAGVRKFTFVVAGPKAFKINKISSDWPHVSFDMYSNPDGNEYHVTATYDGAAPAGRIGGHVTIETDDKDQRVITIPIVGTIKSS